MSPDAIAFIAAAGGLAVLITGLFAWLRSDMAHLDGLLNGLREAISVRAAA